MVWYREKGQLQLGDVARFHITLDTSVLPKPVPSTIYLRLKNTEHLGSRAVQLFLGPFTFYCHLTPCNYNHREKYDQGDIKEVKFKYQINPGKLFNVRLQLNENSELPSLPGVYHWDLDIILMIIISKRPTVGFDLAIGADYKQLKHVQVHPLAMERKPEEMGVKNPLTVVVERTEDIWLAPPKRHDNIHLVILTHGIFLNVLGDMLYLRDQIVENATDNVMVRGYNGNRGKTERGVKRQGEGVGQYVLGLLDENEGKITKLSFVGHSLGGLTQLYAIKHILLTRGQDFFDTRGIELDNLVSFASPLLGILTEVNFVISWFLDLGTLGKTGRDLTLSKSMIGEGNHRPFLERLPDEPLEHALRSFNRRTVYANAVNDGIVPLRTAAILYLDYGALGDVTKIKEHQKIGSPLGPVVTNSEFEVDGVPEDEPSEQEPRISLVTLHSLSQKAKAKKNLRMMAISGKGLDPSSDDLLDITSDITSEDELSVEYILPPRANPVELALNTLINPVPLEEFVVDPSLREPCIFHDKYYCFNSVPEIPESLGFMMRVFANKDWKLKKQVKIALKYHQLGISWRKVLVNLPPDAHNNIVCRRRFANGYGWGVVDHMIDNLFVEDKGGMNERDNSDAAVLSTSPPKL